MLKVKSENGKLTEIMVAGHGIELMAEWAALTWRLMRAFKDTEGVLSKFCLDEFDEIYKEAKKDAGIEE